MQTLREAFEAYIISNAEAGRKGILTDKDIATVLLARDSDGYLEHDIQEKWELAQHIAKWCDK